MIFSKPNKNILLELVVLKNFVHSGFKFLDDQIEYLDADMLRYYCDVIENSIRRFKYRGINIYLDLDRLKILDGEYLLDF